MEVCEVSLLWRLIVAKWPCIPLCSNMLVSIIQWKDVKSYLLNNYEMDCNDKKCWKEDKYELRKHKTISRQMGRNDHEG